MSRASAPASFVRHGVSIVGAVQLSRDPGRRFLGPVRAQHLQFPECVLGQGGWKTRASGRRRDRQGAASRARAGERCLVTIRWGCGPSSEPNEEGRPGFPVPALMLELFSCLADQPPLPALLQPLPKSQLQKPFTGGRFFMGQSPICFVQIASAQGDINLNRNGYQTINYNSRSGPNPPCPHHRRDANLT